MSYRRKLIEVDLPLDAINAESAREKSIRHGHPSTLHLWWARRPLAACRAVLFGQLVDDPSSWPELFRTEEDQKRERDRLFEVIKELVKWESSNSEKVLNAARLEIARSVARGRKADGDGDGRDDAVLVAGVAAAVVNGYLAEVAPPVYDPFAGGGSIPLEAQRLGLRAYASDLNPVAVMINKALIEIPPKFSRRAPVNPRSRKDFAGGWKGAQGLAEDVRYYGEWMRGEAFKRIGHLYPKVQLPEEHGGGEATVIAWLWARTVASPNPAFRDVQVPLVSNFFLSTKPGKETWVEPVLEERGYRFEIRRGAPGDRERIKQGTKLAKGANFRCLVSGVPIEADYIRAEAQAGRMGVRMMAIVAEGNRRRVYLAPTHAMEGIAGKAVPSWRPEQKVTTPCHDVDRLPMYGMYAWGDAFTPRQLVALTTFSDLVLEAREQVRADARSAGWSDDEPGLEAGGEGATAYGDAVAVYLAFCVDKSTECLSSLCTWSAAAKNELVVSTFRRHALPMTWDFAEANPFADSSGSWENIAGYVSRVVSDLSADIPGVAVQRDATQFAALLGQGGGLVSTDPPYYDNIGYGELADFFYVWLRPCAQKVMPSLARTVLVPKAEELIASPYRHGGSEAARDHFDSRMRLALRAVHDETAHMLPVTLYYAFKQAESAADSEGVSSTGWETFLQAVLAAGFMITATLPIRTERVARSISIGANALASSIVLTCRRRPAGATAITRPVFRRLLRQELPRSLGVLQDGHIAPVDMAQAAIGPGMEIFSRHKAVLGADDTPMEVREALILINEALDEYLSEQEGEIDSISRFALTWFEANAFKAGSFGDAETLAKARNVSVEAVTAAGILHSAAQKVRLLTRKELTSDWDPVRDGRGGAWGAVHHLIKRLSEHGEQSAADLLSRLGPLDEQARGLAYRLYNICDRNGWAEDARDYNGLVTVWPELEALAAAGRPATRGTEQTELPMEVRS